MRIDLSDVCVVASLACLGVFAWLFWPAGLLVPAGVLFAALAFLLAMRPKKRGDL